MTNADTLLFAQVPHVLVQGTPSFEPVLPGELAVHAHVDSVDGEELLASYLASARYWVENELQMALASRSFTLYLDMFPAWEIQFRLPPVTAITAVNYIDTDGDAQVLDSSIYVTDLVHSPARLTPQWGKFFPYTRPIVNSVNITGTCGFASASAVPEPAKQAIRYLAAMMYEQREPGPNDLKIAQRILDPIRWEGRL